MSRKYSPVVDAVSDDDLAKLFTQVDTSEGEHYQEFSDTRMLPPTCAPSKPAKSSAPVALHPAHDRTDQRKPVGLATAAETAAQQAAQVVQATQASQPSALQQLFARLLEQGEFHDAPSPLLRMKRSR